MDINFSHIVGEAKFDFNEIKFIVKRLHDLNVYFITNAQHNRNVPNYQFLTSRVNMRPTAEDKISLKQIALVLFLCHNSKHTLHMFLITKKNSKFYSYSNEIVENDSVMISFVMSETIQISEIRFKIFTIKRQNNLSV